MNKFTQSGGRVVRVKVSVSRELINNKVLYEVFTDRPQEEDV